MLMPNIVDTTHAVSIYVICLSHKRTSSPWAVTRSWLCSMSYKLSEVGRTDLVFGLWSEFISKSADARLQISTCSGYDSCHPG